MSTSRTLAVDSAVLLPVAPRWPARWDLVALIALPLWLVACADEPRRPLGASCDSHAQCESGLCVDGVCVDPQAPSDATTDAGDGDAADAPDAPPSTIVTARPVQVGNDPVAVFEFVSDPPGASFDCIIDGGEPEPCASPLSLEVGEGEHTLTVIARWADGAVNPSPPTYTWVVDLTAPVTTFIAAPAPYVDASEVTFELAASEPGVIWSCSVDGGPWEPCESPLVISGLADGAHRLEILAEDAAGNVEEEPATHDWTVDTSTPDTQIDSGPSAITAATGATFTFSALNVVTAATFACSLDEEPFAPCTSPREVSGLADGAHTFEVRARSAAGREDPSPAEWAWVVDTVAPVTGVCGSANGGSTVATPLAGLCAAGTASAVSGSGPYTWTCVGSGSGTTASCAANRSCAAVSQVWTVGESACEGGVAETGHGGSATASDAAAPTTGGRTYACSQGTWSGVGAGTCVTAVDGACGSAHGGSTTSAPSTNLCSSGSATGVSGDGPYTWSCNGSDGGSNASCSSNRSCDATTLSWGACSAARSAAAHGFSGVVANTAGGHVGSATSTCDQGTWALSATSCDGIVNGACGSAHGGSTASAPSANLCSSGAATSVGGSGPYTWTCNGGNGGSNASCSSNRSCAGAAQTWTVSTSTCDASVATAAHGGASVATDAGLPTTGSRSYACNQGTWSGSGPGTCVTAVDGACGSAHSGSTASTPNTALCSSGAPTSVSGSGPYTWTCNGSDGGSNASCASNRSCGATTLSWGACSAARSAAAHGFSEALTNAAGGHVGSATSTCNQGTWALSATSCDGIVNGACGSAHGGSTASAPSANLCDSGSATGVSGSGPYTWSCNGSNGGSNASCSSNRTCAGAAQTWSVSTSTCNASVATAAHGGASVATDNALPTTGSRNYTCSQGTWSGSGAGTCVTAVNGACGSAHGGSTTSAPSTNLCDSGSATSVSGGGPYTWSCNGSDGGSNASCASNRSCAGTGQTWSVSTSTCNASVATAAHGGASVATDNALPTTGSRNYTCSQGTWSGSGAGTCVTAVNGACGSAHGGSTTSPPGTNLCDSGSATSVSGGGPYSWSCNGSNGGSNASCSSNRSCVGTAQTWTVINSTCDANVATAAHGGASVATDNALPTTGSRNYTCSQGTWSGSGAGTCVTAVNGACGSAHGGSTTSAPSTNLCDSGSATSVSGGGPYTWSCNGSDGGSNASCSSNRSCVGAAQTWTVVNSTCNASVATFPHGAAAQANDTTTPTTGSRTYTCSQGTWTGLGTGSCVTALNGACGSAHGGSTTSAPSTNLCNSGSATSVSGSGPYTWSCNGSNGGSNASCSSNRSCVGTSRSWSVSGNTCTGNTSTVAHGSTSTASDTTAPARGSRNHTCSQGTWTGSGTGSCVTLTITEGPDNNGTYYNMSSVTYRFSVTGYPSSVQCRVYLNGTTAPAYTSCSGSFTRSIYTTSSNYWVFHLRVQDAFGTVWTITRTFWNRYFG